MRRYLLAGLIFAFLGISLFGQTTPHTVSMASGDNNFTAFGANGQLGSNGATFYLH